MNTFQFLWLLKEIYSAKKPDLDKIQKLGLLAVKIAQMHALRSDFFGVEKCRHLAKLYQRTDAARPEHVQELLTRAPKKFRARISDLQEEPFASASVGQVHDAKLDDGTEVIVKIIKAQAKQEFLKDIKRVRRIVKVMLFFSPKLRGVGNPLGIIEDIERYTTPELDLRNEKRGQEKLLKAYETFRKDVKLDKLAFPQIYSEITNENIMVAEKVQGKSLDERMREESLEFSDVLELFEIHGSFLFIAGVFHGDLHPGNAISHDGKLYLIDTSYVAKASKKMRQQFFRFFQALAAYDYDQCVDHLISMSKTALSPKQEQSLRNGFHELYKDFKGKTVSEVSLTKQMMDSIRLGVESGIQLDQEVFPIIKSLMYMDGMVLGVDPDIVLMEEMKPVLQRFEKFVL